SCSLAVARWGDRPDEFGVPGSRTSYADLPAASKSLGPASWRGGWDRSGFAFQALRLLDLLGGRLPASRLPALLRQPLHSPRGDAGGPSVRNGGHSSFPRSE